MRLLFFQLLALSLASISSLTSAEIHPNGGPGDYGDTDYPDYRAVNLNKTAAGVRRHVGWGLANDSKVDHKRLASVPGTKAFNKSFTNVTRASRSGFAILPEHLRNVSNVTTERCTPEKVTGGSFLEEYRRKGKETWAKLHAAIDEHHPDIGPKDIDMEEYRIEDNGWEKIGDLMSMAWSYLGLTRLSSHYAQSISVYSDKNSINWFKNLFNPAAYTIIASSSYRTLGEPAADHWTDIVFPLWRQVTREQGKRVSDLTYVMQEAIMNDDTETMLREIVPDYKGSRDFYRFNPSNDDFYALLQGPNVIGSAYLCINYATSLEFKTIKSITAFWDEDYTLWTIIVELGHEH